MSKAPKAYQGTNLEGVDWHGPVVDIIDELVDRRLTDLRKRDHYLYGGGDAWEDALEWGDTVCHKYVQALHPHLEGKV
jgi:hypothetical protein